MLNKLEKWGLKVWCLACSTLTYIWNFEVYCRKENILLIVAENVDESLTLVQHSEPKLAHNVVLRMVEGLLQVNHIVVMDHFFSSIGLFKELLSKGMYSTNTMRPSWVGIAFRFGK